MKIDVNTMYREYVDNYNFFKKEKKDPVTNINQRGFYVINQRSIADYVELNNHHSMTSSIENLPDNFTIAVHYSSQVEPVVDVLFFHGFRLQGGVHGLTMSSYKLTHAELESRFTIEGKNHMTGMINEITGYLNETLSKKETLCATKDYVARKNSSREKIIPITFISDKKYISDIERTVGEKLDWKHSWKVMGHWREISGIGKDRDGNYCMIGKTWVNPCIRGDGPMIEKLKIIKSIKITPPPIKEEMKQMIH